MKKIIVITALLAFFVPVVSFAAGKFPTDLITLSKNVSGSYFIDSTATEYSLSTGHSQGSRVYATSSNDSLIYYKEITTTFASTDLLGAHNSSFVSDKKGFTKN